MAKEFVQEVRVVASGFRIGSFGAEDDEVKAASEDLRSNIADVLSGLGQWCDHGTVEIELVDV